MKVIRGSLHHKHIPNNLVHSLDNPNSSNSNHLSNRLPLRWGAFNLFLLLNNKANLKSSMILLPCWMIQGITLVKILILTNHWCIHDDSIAIYNQLQLVEDHHLLPFQIKINLGILNLLKVFWSLVHRNQDFSPVQARKQLSLMKKSLNMWFDISKLPWKRYRKFHPFIITSFSILFSQFKIINLI